MPGEVSAGRRRRFLKALAACGNVTLAAEKAGVSRSWASLTRRAEPKFDAGCRAALAEAEGRLRMAADNKAPPGWERSGGVALTRFGRRGRVQLVRSARLVWAPAAEARFLAIFEQCCNAKLACGLAGMTVSSYERHRRRWPGFRRRLQKARAIGRERIQAELAAKRAKPVDFAWLEAMVEAAERAPPPSIKVALDMARRHKFRRD